MNTDCDQTCHPKFAILFKYERAVFGAVYEPFTLKQNYIVLAYFTAQQEV